MRLARGFALLLLLGAFSLWAQDSAWKEFRSSTGRFVADFPGTPEASEEKDEQRDLVLHSFSVAGGGRVFGILYTDYPEAEIAETGVDGMMDADRDSFAQGVGGKVSEERAVKCGDHPGRRFLVTTEEGKWLSVQVCFARPRMYMGLAGSAKNALPADAARFHNSFRILPQARP